MVVALFIHSKISKKGGIAQIFGILYRKKIRGVYISTDTVIIFKFFIICNPQNQYERILYSKIYIYHKKFLYFYLKLFFISKKISKKYKLKLEGIFLTQKLFSH